MYVLYDIEVLPEDLQNVPEDAVHKLTFKAVYTIKDVPDTFPGVVYQAANNELKLEHFNNPRGNVRKIITLKNKLPEGVFAGIKGLLLAMARGHKYSFPENNTQGILFNLNTVLGPSNTSNGVLEQKDEHTLLGSLTAEPTMLLKPLPFPHSAPHLWQCFDTVVLRFNAVASSRN